MTEKQEQALAESKSALKKVRAAKGRLQANFYWVGNSRLDSVGLFVTLSSKDAKGAKALTRGKDLRKEVSGAKFGRGLVKMQKGKLVFELSGGNANKGMIQKSFIRTLSKADGMTYIKQAVVVTPSADSAEEVEAAIDGGKAVAEVELTAEERTELEADVAAQQALTTLNSTLTEAFLSEDDARREAGEAISESLDRLTQLKGATPVDAAAIKAERASLAETLWTGNDPFPAPGGDLSPEVREVLAAALVGASDDLRRHLGLTGDRITEIHQIASTAPESALVEQAPGLLGELATHRAAYDSYVQQLQENLTN